MGARTTMSKLRRLYPTAASMATSAGATPVPHHVERGSTASVFGVGSLAAVKKHFRLEGQTTFPLAVTTTTADEVNAEGEGEGEVEFGEKTPVIVTVSSFEGGTAGAYDEVSVGVIATHHRLDQLVRRHAYLVPYMMENLPAARLYPLMTYVSTAQAAAVNREVFHIPTEHRSSLRVHRDDATGAVTHATLGDRAALSDVPPAVPHLLGALARGGSGTEDAPLFRCPPSAPALFTPAFFRKWQALHGTVGLDRLAANWLEGKQELRYTVPHGRGTVKTGGRAVNDYTGTVNPAGVVSGVDMSTHAAPCTTDFSAVFSNARAMQVGLPGENCVVELGEELGFEADLVLHAPEYEMVRLLPQRTVLPLHQSDQKTYELKELVEECAVLLEQRRPHMELPGMTRQQRGRWKKKI